MMQKKPSPPPPGAIERQFTIVNKFGIHARPAALFVKTVAPFQCEVTVEREGFSVNGKSIMGLLMLEGHVGAVLRVTANGPDAEEALRAIQDLIEKKFYED